MFTRQPGDNGYPEICVQPHLNNSTALDFPLCPSRRESPVYQSNPSLILSVCLTLFVHVCFYYCVVIAAPICSTLPFVPSILICKTWCRLQQDLSTEIALPNCRPHALYIEVALPQRNHCYRRTKGRSCFATNSGSNRKRRIRIVLWREILDTGLVWVQAIGTLLAVGARAY